MQQWVTETMIALGYLGLFLLLIAETIFPPIPSEVVLPLAGFLAGRGFLDVRLALVVATLGSYTAATLLYMIGRFGSRNALLRFGQWLHLDPTTVASADRWFLRWGSLVVLGGRLVPVARSVVSVPAGTFRMPFWRFSVLTIVGSGAWNTALMGSGWLLGENWELVVAWVDRYTTVVIVLAAIGLSVLSALAIRRRSRWLPRLLRHQAPSSHSRRNRR